MRTVFLVPRRAGVLERDRSWAWCAARWQRILPDVRIYEGHHDDGPFNRAKAVNTAATLADADGPWDLGVVIDADIFLRRSQAQAAIDMAARTGRVTWGHRRWRGVAKDWTARWMDDRQDLGPEFDDFDMDLYVERTNPISWSCFQVIPRAVWDDLGGFDERFVGWGFEDMAFQSIVSGLYGYERIETLPDDPSRPADVYHLWHPRSEERIVPGQPAFTATAEYITNARLGRRYMVAARRDHGVHDRPGTADPEEMARDIANLHRDDAKLREPAADLNLPNWEGWWPSLEELRDGAKLARLGPAPDVTVVVRTGGEPETWPDRSGYLRRSLASLNEHVSGPIVQRVVYSDWGPEFADELAAIAAEHGFYVAGDGHHGYAGSVQRLWRYLPRRAVGQFVFLAEDDFLYERDVDLVPMVDTLLEEPALLQVALLRAAAYPREVEAGGVLESLKTELTPIAANGHSRIEHRDHWTMNPSLVRRSIAERPWPEDASSERVFGDQVLRDREVRFAYWGDGQPWITHIGETRAAHAY